MQEARLGRIAEYAETQLQKAVLTKNKDMQQLAEDLIMVLKEWAMERKEAKEFYNELKNYISDENIEGRYNR